MSNVIQPYIYKFLSVSVLNTVVDLTVFNALFYLVGDAKSLVIFIGIKGTAFLFAVTNSYFWNSRWTFKERDTALEGRESVSQFSKFLGINLTALLINVSAASIVFLFIQDAIQNHFVATNISAIVGSIFGMLVNLNGYKKLFKKDYLPKS